MTSAQGNNGTCKYLYMVLCFFMLVSATEQIAAQIVVDADSVAQLGQRFRLRYQYSTNDTTDKIVSPKWEWEKNNRGFDILYGPSRSTTTSTYSINGRISTTYEETFYFTLSFNKEGCYTMPIMHAQTESGKNVSSKPFSVRATKDAESSESNTSKHKPSKSDLLVAEAIVNKDHISLGDSVVCEIRLYTNLDIRQMSLASTKEICPAYWHEHELPNETSFKTLVYKGDSVPSILRQKFSIIPLQAGEIVLEPMKFTVTRLDKSLDPFELFFNAGSAYVLSDTVIMTNPIKIQVDNRQLPDDVIALDSKMAHDLGIVIDRSSSLNAQSDSLAPTYLQLENLFAEQLAKEKVLTDYSVTLFAGKPHFPKFSHLTDVSRISPSEKNDGSAIYDAILASALRDGALTTERSPYSVLLLTDGSDNSSRLSEKTLTNLLLRHHIKVNVIAFASRNDSVYYLANDTIGRVKIKNTHDFSDVERIAKATGGFFVHIFDKKQIPDAIQKVKSLEMGLAPNKQPDNDFSPEPYLLNLLYKEIVKESESDF